MKVLAIFDKPYTVDRFTVIVNTPVNPDQPFYDALGCDDNGGNSFSQWTQAQWTPGGKNPHLGKLVNFTDLNEATQRHISLRIFGADYER